MLKASGVRVGGTARCCAWRPRAVRRPTPDASWPLSLRRKRCLAVGLEVLQLHAFRLLQLTFQQEAVEDPLGQRRRERVEPCARREQRCQRGALETGRACQLNLRKERRAGGFDAEVGGG